MVVINKGNKIPQQYTERHCMPQSDLTDQTEKGDMGSVTHPSS